MTAKVGRYYKSSYDSSIIKVTEINDDVVSFEMIEVNYWHDYDGKFTLGKDYFNPESHCDDQYIELPAYNTPLYKAMNG